MTDSGIRPMMEPLFTKKEAAAYLKVSERTVDREIGRLGLIVFEIGRVARTPALSLMQPLNEATPHKVGYAG